MSSTCKPKFFSDHPETRQARSSTQIRAGSSPHCKRPRVLSGASMGRNRCVQSFVRGAAHGRSPHARAHVGVCSRAYGCSRPGATDELCHCVRRSSTLPP